MRNGEKKKRHRPSSSSGGVQKNLGDLHENSQSNWQLVKRDILGRLGLGRFGGGYLRIVEHHQSSSCEYDHRVMFDANGSTNGCCWSRTT